MKTPTETTHRRLAWTQPNTGMRFFELRSDDVTVGTLRFRSGLGTLATAESAEGTWTLKRVGFLNPRVTVRVAGSDEDLAVYQPKMWGDGVVLFRNGASFDWKPTNFWRTAWCFTAPKGHPLVHLLPGIEDSTFWDVFKTQCTVQVLDAPEARDYLPILLPLALYLLILQHDDAAAAAAGCSAVV